MNGTATFPAVSLVLIPGFITLYIYYIVTLRFVFILLAAPDMELDGDVTAVQISEVLSSHVIVCIFNKMKVVVQSVLV